MRLLLALLLLALPAGARSVPIDEMVEIEAGKPLTLRSDRAYLLFRRIRPEGVLSVEPIFMRIPSESELARYEAARRQAWLHGEPALIRQREAQLRKKAEAEAEGREYKGDVPPPPSIETFNFVYDEVANVRRVDTDKAFVSGRPESVYLVEVLPGDFVLYGANYGSAALKPSLIACMCLGTVGFTAPAGMITDLGYFMGDRVDKVSKIPELTAESGFGSGAVAFIAPLGATVRPVRPDSTVPEALRGMNVRPAHYRAIGRFVDGRAATVNRLAPVPGILAYDGRRVIDVKTGGDARGSQ
ncbi:MAG TPA: hypothetical protein VF605_11585 [Allosphingosinicella sp.]|jgi:hypothetical protein